MFLQGKIDITTTTDIDTARIEKAVIEKAREINIVVDYSKIGKISPVPYGEKLKEKKMTEKERKSWNTTNWRNNTSYSFK